MNFRVATDTLPPEGSSPGPLGAKPTKGTPGNTGNSSSTPRSTASMSSSALGRQQSEGHFVFLLAGDLDHCRMSPGRRTDWTRLIQFAWDEGAILTVHNFIRRLERGVVPVAVERQLACLALERELRMRLLEQRARESLSVLTSAGIDVVLLKGAALATTIYGSFVGRPMNDVDMLVHPERAEDAKRRMLDAGWIRDVDLPDDAVYLTHHHLAPLLDSRGSRCRLEIHRSLLPPGHPFALSDSELWAHARPVEIGGHRALVLEPNYHALHIAIHFAWSHTMRAGAWHSFRDLGALARAGLIDWPELVRLAVRTRAATCCYWTLKLAKSMSGLAVPDDVLAALQPRMGRGMLNRLERHFEHVLLRRDASHLSLRLDRALWSMAIHPRQQGHGESRPWLVSSELTAARLRHDTTSAADRVRRQFDRIARCSVYMAGLVWR